MKSCYVAKLKLDISKLELESMKASEVIVTFSLSVAKQCTQRIAAGKNLLQGDMHFLVKRKESELLFRNRFSSG